MLNTSPSPVVDPAQHGAAEEREKASKQESS